MELLEAGDAEGALTVAYELRGAIDELEAAATAAPARGGRGSRLVPLIELDPYVAWESRPVPVPHTAGPVTLRPVLMEIVEAEGPIYAGRAFALYSWASGKKYTSAAKAPLAGAAWQLKDQGLLTVGREDATRIENDDVLRPVGTPEIHVRQLGTRTLTEVPLEEIAELMVRLRGLSPTGEIDLKRAVLDTYGLARMTARADEYLESALELL